MAFLPIQNKFALLAIEKYHTVKHYKLRLIRKRYLKEDAVF